MNESGRMGRCLFYPAFMLLLAGMTLFLLVLVGSESSNPLILHRYSLPLASVMLLITLIVLTGLLSLIFRTERVLYVAARIVSSLDRIPALLELSIMFGWIPILFMFIAGKGFFPLAGEALFLLGLLFVYIGFSMIATTSVTLSRRKTLAERILLLGVSTLVGLIALEVVIRIVSPRSIFSTAIELIPHQNLTINVDLPGMSPVITYTTNSMGLRAEEPPRRLGQLAHDCHDRGQHDSLLLHG